MQSMQPLEITSRDDCASPSLTISKRRREVVNCKRPRQTHLQCDSLGRCGTHFPFGLWRIRYQSGVVATDYAYIYFSLGTVVIIILLLCGWAAGCALLIKTCLVWSLPLAAPATYEAVYWLVACSSACLTWPRPVLWLLVQCSQLDAPREPTPSACPPLFAGSLTSRVKGVLKVKRRRKTRSSTSFTRIFLGNSRRFNCLRDEAIVLSLGGSNSQQINESSIEAVILCLIASC